MRRVLALGALALVSALLSVPEPVEGQTPSIRMSLVRTVTVDGVTQEEVIRNINEGGDQVNAVYRATVDTAPTADVTVGVTVNNWTGTTPGSCTFTNMKKITSCGSTIVDYGIYTGDGTTSTGINDNTFNVTIKAGQTSGEHNLWIVAPADDTMENPAGIWIQHSTPSGYANIGNYNITITDEHRVIRFSSSRIEGMDWSEGADANRQVNDQVQAYAGRNRGTTRDTFEDARNNSFTSATLRPRIRAVDGTAVSGTEYELRYPSGDSKCMIWGSGNLWTQTQANCADSDTNTGDFYIWRLGASQDTIAEGDKTFEFTFDQLPSGFRAQPLEIVFKDDSDDDIIVTVDTDTAANGVQSVWREGVSGSGVVVTAGYPAATTSSAVPSETVVTLSAEAPASPEAGQAGADDFSYSPSSPDTVTIPAMSMGSDTASLADLTVMDDDVVEGPETFTVTGTLSSDTVGPLTGAVVTIGDDDADIALSVDRTLELEEGDAVDVVVTARFAGSSSVLTSATDVTVTAAGAASGGVSNSDFTLAAVTGGPAVSNNEFTISIPAGDTNASGTVRLTAVDDSASEGTEGAETLVFSGSAAVGTAAVDVSSAEVVLSEPGVVTLTLAEADSGEAALSGVSEAGGQQRVRVKAAGVGANTASAAVTVTVGAAGDSADEGSSNDYTRSSETVVITLQNGRGSADVTITPRDDGVAEGTETIRFDGSAPAGVSVVGADLDITEAIALTLSAASVAEGAGDAGDVSVTASFAGAQSSELTGAVDVTLSFAAGADAEAADFTAPGTAVVLSIPMGSTSIASSATALSGLGITGDMIAEGPESVLVDGSAAGFTVEGAVLEITDDDLDVVLTADTDGGTPGNQKELPEDETGAVRVRAALGSGVTNDLSESLVVSVTAGEDSPSSADGGGMDFTAPDTPVSVVILTGSTTSSSWTTLTGLSVTDDAVAEAAETFLITGTVPGGTVTSDTLTIPASDDDLEVSVSPGTVVEQAAAHSVTVTAGFKDATGSELTAATTVNMAVAAGDTDAATLASSCPPTTEDACVSAATFDVSIPAGQVSASGTFDLTARDDSSAEAGGENLKVTGTMSGDSTNSESVTVRIVDEGITLEFLDTNDTALTSLMENSDMTTVRVKATAPSAVSAATVVGVNITGGTAAADAGNSWDEGEDFRVSGLSAPSGTPSGHALGIEIAANATTGQADFTIEVNDDNADEVAETILITGGDVGTLPVVGAGLEITDNDTPPANIDLTLETPDGDPLTSVREDGGTTRVQVKAAYQDGTTTVLSRALVVPITVGGSGTGEAASGTDYQAVTGVNVVIPAYQSSGLASFNLVIGSDEDDSDAEGPETVTVSGGTVTGFTIGTDSLTIVDDDAAVTLTLLDSATPPQPLASLAEGTASTTVTVQAAYPGSNVLSPASAQTVAVSVGGGTAVADDDYQATVPDPFEITIASGANSGTESFTLALDAARDDRISEEDKTLTVTGALADFIVNAAVLTITDNDDPPTGIDLTLSPASVREDRGSSSLTVNATASLVGNPRSQPTEVAVRAGGAGTTASSERDYRNLRPSSFTITIPAGQQSAQASFEVVILADTLSEGTERIAVTGTAADLGNASDTVYLNITNVAPPAPPPPPPPSGGGGGGGGGAPPPAQPPAQPPAPVCTGRFCDDDGNVHEANIERIAVWRITLGCDAQDATKYCPNAQITRRQMSAFLHRAVSQRWTIQAPEGIVLADVEADEWFRPFAEWVVSVGAFSTTNDLFNPGGVVTRADMAIMMIGAFPHLDAVPTETSRFGDVEGLSPEVLAALEGMYQTGVTRGCSAEPLDYCPNQPVTRAQMASFFVRAINRAPADTQPTAAAQP